MDSTARFGLYYVEKEPQNNNQNNYQYYNYDGPQQESGYAAFFVVPKISLII